MGSVNKVTLLGNLGQDPDVRMTPSGQQVCTISIATSENWMNKDGKREERTEWHRVVLWGRQAELAGKYLKKGRKVYIEGRLQTRSWEDQGQKKYTTEIISNQIVFIDSAGKGDMPTDVSNEYQSDSQQYGGPNYSNNGKGSTSNNTNSSSFPSDDDVPF